MTKPHIVTKTGKKPGPTVAVFAGVHGNERVGIMALESLVPTIQITAGTVHFVIANPEAAQKNVRYIEKNLNRIFLEGGRDNSLEGLIAGELMELLKSCDALLDLHACNEPDIDPFIICEETSLELAKTFDVQTISFNWKHFEEGSTDAFMDRQGKLAIGLECGSLSGPEAHVGFAKRSILHFLSYMGNLSNASAVPPMRPMRIVKIVGATPMPPEGIIFRQDYRTFQKMVKGEIFAESAGKEHIFPVDGVIVFPRPHAPVGAEAYLVGMVM